MISFNEHFASVGDCEIQYRVAGSGQPLVMLHGAGGFRFDARTFEALAAHYTLIVPSMPGFDRSTPGAADSLLDVADIMAEFIRTATGGSAAVIGESFGGAVSSWLAIRHPEVVSRLVLAAPAGLTQQGSSISGLSPAQMAVMLYGQAPTTQPTPEEAARRAANRENAVRIIRARPGFDPELQQHLADIKASTLVLWGTADQMIWPSQARYFIEAIPNAQLVTLDGAPHVLAAAVPEEFVSAVLGFLDQPQAVAAAPQRPDSA